MLSEFSRFSSELPTKNAILLVVTAYWVAGGPNSYPSKTMNFYQYTVLLFRFFQAAMLPEYLQMWH